MNCPYCGSLKSKVVDKRDNESDGTTRRRRECLKCSKRFTTQEKIERIDLTVIKKDGRAESFNRDKVFRSFTKAVNLDLYPIDKVEKLVDDIEMRLLNRKSSHVTSTDIGNMILTRLKRHNPVGYMRYAAVYKDFETLEEIENELASLRNAP